MIRSKNPDGVVYYLTAEEDEQIRKILAGQLPGANRDVIDDLDTLCSLLKDSRGVWDPKHDQNAKCAGCSHSYERHFDTYADMEPVGCKYCDCGMFVELADFALQHPES